MTPWYRTSETPPQHGYLGLANGTLMACDSCAGNPKSPRIIKSHSGRHLCGGFFKCQTCSIIFRSHPNELHLGPPTWALNHWLACNSSFHHSWLQREVVDHGGPREIVPYRSKRLPKPRWWHCCFGGDEGWSLLWNFSLILVRRWCEKGCQQFIRCWLSTGWSWELQWLLFEFPIYFHIFPIPRKSWHETC